MPVLSPPATETNAAPSLLRTPRFRRLLYAQGCFGLAYSAFLILPKYLATELHAGPATIGWLMATAAIAPVVAAPLVSRLCQRLGAGRCMALASAMMALGAAAFLGVDSAGPLAFVCRALHGLSWALIFSAASILVLDLAGPRRLGEGLALHGSSNLISNALGPALAEPVIARWGARPVFAAAALAAALGVWLALRVGGARRERIAGERAPGAAGDGPLPLPVLLTSGVLGVACGVMLFFHQPLALSRGLEQVSGFLVAYTLAAVAVRLGLGRLPDRVGVGKVAVASFFLYGLVVAAMATLRTPGGLLLLGAGFGVAHGLFWPSFLSLAVASTHSGSKERLLAYVNAMFCAGVGSVGLLGSVVERLGYGVVFAGVGLLVVLSAAGLRYTVLLLGGRSATPTCPK